MTEQAEQELARTIAQADFIWDLGEQGVMACSPELAGRAFDDAWRDATSSTRQKFIHIAQVVLATGYVRGALEQKATQTPPGAT